jgi:putative SOS response-associated peptidase YedK
MCGRYASTKAPADLADEFRAVDATDGAKVADFNVAPTKQVAIVVERHPRDDEGTPDADRVERTLRMVRWGLVPSWSKDASGGARMINARVESATQKPAFRRAIRSRRCLLPADGWYEWQRAAAVAGSTGPKQPYFTHYRDGSSLALAGLWEYWKPKDDPDAEGLVTCAVLTTEAVGPLAQVHDRMPLVLPPSAWEAWLDPDRPADDAAVAPLLGPVPAELVARMELRPVSPRVNNVRNNGPELLEALPPEEVAEPLQLDLLAGPNPR